MASDLTVTLQHATGLRALVLIEGPMDFDTVTPLQEDLTALVDAGHPRLVLDMSGVTFCDSTGLNALLRVLNHAQEHQGSVALAAAGENLRRILAMTGVEDVLIGYPTSAEAVARTPEA